MAIRVPPDSTGAIVETITLAGEHRQVFIQGGDGAVAERVAVVNTAPAATAYGGTVRAIQRREGQELSTAALGIAGVFTQGAQDGNEDGSVFVAAVAESDQNSAAQGFVIQEYDGDDDDFTDASYIRTVAAATYTAATPQYIYARIRGRKWRVQFTNGGVGQANFKITAASSAIVQDHHIDYDSGAGTVEVPIVGIALPGAGGPVAGGTTANPLVGFLVSDDGTSVADDANDAINVNIVAGSAGATEFNEDDPAAGGEAGPQILGVRRDADTTPVGADGDFHTLIFDNAGALKTNVRTSALPAGAATAAAQLADGHNVTVDNAAGAAAVNVQDGGNSLTVDNAQLSVVGGGTEAAALRVTIASDSTGVLSIDDNGANLSVDWGGTVPPIGAGTEAAALRVTLATDSTGVITVDNAGVFVVQEDGAALTALQLIDNPVFVDDAAFALTTSSAMVAGAIRDDALGALAAVEGDVVPLRVNATGALHVTGGGGGTEPTDDTSTHTSGASVGTSIMGVATPTDGAVDANDFGHLAMSLDRRLLTDAQIVGQDADISIDDGGNNISVDWAGTVPPIGAGTEAAALRVTVATDSTGVITVDNAGVFVVQEDGAALTALQVIDNPVFVDDAPFALTTSSAMVAGAIRDDALATLTAVEGDVVPLRVSATGALHITGGGGGFEPIDDTSTHATGTSIGTSVMAVATPTDGAVDANDFGHLAMSLDRRLLTDAQIVGQDADITVDNGGTFVVQEDGAALTALQVIDNPVFVDDAAFALTTSSVLVAGAIRDDVLATLTAVEGDAVPLRVSATGALHITGGGGGFEPTDDTSTHTTGTSIGTSLMAVAVPTDAAVDANDFGHLAMSLDRRLLVDSQIVGQDADISIDDGGNVISVDWNGTVPPIGAGTEAAALRVTLATDSTGLLSVDDNGGSLTIDNNGTFVVQEDGAALTALQLIDNPVFVDNAAFALTTSSVMVAGAIRDDTLATLAAAENDAVPLRVNSTGALHVTGGGGGTEPVDDTTTHATGTSVGTSIMGVAVPTDGAVDANDFGHLAMSLDRRLLVDSQIVGQDADITIADGGNAITVDWAGTAPPIGAGVEATALRVTLATDSTGRIEVVGDVASDAPAAGNPVLIGLRASETEGAEVADDDAIYAWGDLVGRTVTVKNHPSLVAADSTHGPRQVTKTTTAIEDVIAAPGASLSIYLTSIFCSNTSATFTRIDLSDGAMIRDGGGLAADGGGFVRTYDPPWKMTANTAFRATCSAAVTDVRINPHYFVAA